MHKEIYNNYILFEIVKHIKYNPYYAIGMLEDYINNYPNDYLGYLNLAQVFIDVGEFENANSLFQLIDYVFPDKIDERVNYNKLRLFTFMKNYDKAKELYDKTKDQLKEFDPKVEMFETFYAVNSGEKLERSSLSSMYLYNQIVDYRDKDFFSHIRKHLADYNRDLDEPNSAIFNSNFPIDKVLRELKTIIPNDKKTYFSLFTNFYVFKYNNAGRIDNKSVDYFRVVTVNDTNNFITMYPLQHGEALPYIDLNYLNNDFESSNVKTLSRVNKFYNKYGILNKK